MHLKCNFVEICLTEKEKDDNATNANHSLLQNANVINLQGFDISHVLLSSHPDLRSIVSSIPITITPNGTNTRFHQKSEKDSSRF
jgi:hypothetical protein